MNLNFCNLWFILKKKEKKIKKKKKKMKYRIYSRKNKFLK